MGQYRTEHGQMTEGLELANQAQMSERLRVLSRQCYLLERGLLCGPCYQ